MLAGRLEMYARSLVILTFGGGTNEIQRDLIAIFGLGTARSPLGTGRSAGGRPPPDQHHNQPDETR